MGNKFKNIDIKNLRYCFFWWHDEDKKSWSKQNEKRWKVIKKIVLFITLDVGQLKI